MREGWFTRSNRPHPPAGTFSPVHVGCFRHAPLKVPISGRPKIGGRRGLSWEKEATPPSASSAASPPAAAVFIADHASARWHEARQVVRPAGLGSGAGQALAAEGLARRPRRRPCCGSHRYSRSRAGLTTRFDGEAGAAANAGRGSARSRSPAISSPAALSSSARASSARHARPGRRCSGSQVFGDLVAALMMRGARKLPGSAGVLAA
jgi:hypothetical protein